MSDSLYLILKIAVFIIGFGLGVLHEKYIKKKKENKYEG